MENDSLKKNFIFLNFFSVLKVAKVKLFVLNFAEKGKGIFPTNS